MGEAAYRNPVPTVDVIIDVAGADVRSIVLIKRRNAPHGWALPGGFVDYGEPVAVAARREAKEETSLDVELSELFHVYSNPTRDDRLHSVSVVFLAATDGAPVAADDAADVGVFPLSELPSPLVFDHSLILEDYQRYLETGKRPPPHR